MTWKPDQLYKAESKKIVWEVAPYLRGRGIDLGAGTFKILPQAISLDNCFDNMELGGNFIQPDIKVDTAEDLKILGSQSFDWVYSSHLLEHLVDPLAALKEWWRILKVGGKLVLYLPHEDLYPKVGTPGSNQDHKHDLNEEKVTAWMKEVGFWDMLRCEKREQDDEYSFLMVLQKRDAKKHSYSYQKPKPEKTACVVRYGAYGDMIMATSVLAGLKEEGYHVSLFCSPPGSDVILHDPNIDEIVLFDKDQVPNADLGAFWKHQRTKYDKWVNLSESIEGTFLALPGRTQHEWKPLLRHKLMNFNYIEFAHLQAGLPLHPERVKFYATAEEKAWAKKFRQKTGEFTIVWSLAGSSPHKTWGGLDNIIASVLVTDPRWHIVLVGAGDAMLLQAGWDRDPRVHKMVNQWTMRETMSFLEQADIVIGPETGVLNAAAQLDAIKLLFLSHSSHENLSRDWKNTVAFSSENTSCPGRGENEAPACHQLHFSFEFCKLHSSGVAQCQADISIQEVWLELDQAMQEVTYKRRAA